METTISFRVCGLERAYLIIKWQRERQMKRNLRCTVMYTDFGSREEAGAL